MKSGDDSNSDIAGYYRYSGDIRNSCKDYNGAVSDYLQFIHFFDLDYGEYNAKSGDVYAFLAKVFAKTGETAKLLEYQEKAVHAYERVYGRAHSETIELYERIYRTYMNVWDDTANSDILISASETLKILINAYSEFYEDDTASLASCYMRYSCISSMLNRQNECTEYMQYALRIYDSVLDSDDEYWMITLKRNIRKRWMRYSALIMKRYSSISR